MTGFHQIQRDNARNAQLMNRGNRVVTTPLYPGNHVVIKPVEDIEKFMLSDEQMGEVVCPHDAAYDSDCVDEACGYHHGEGQLPMDPPEKFNLICNAEDDCGRQDCSIHNQPPPSPAVSQLSHPGQPYPKSRNHLLEDKIQKMKEPPKDPGGNPHHRLAHLIGQRLYANDPDKLLAMIADAHEDVLVENAKRVVAEQERSEKEDFKGLSFKQKHIVLLLREMKDVTVRLETSVGDEARRIWLEDIQKLVNLMKMVNDL